MENLTKLLHTATEAVQNEAYFHNHVFQPLISICEKTGDDIKVCESHSNKIECFKEEVLNEALQKESQKIIEKTDGLMSHHPSNLENDIVYNNSKLVQEDSTSSGVSTDDNTIDTNDQDDEFSDDDSDFTEESEEEFMPDGERIRKTSRGFKQISNCKRFWKASMLMG